MSCPESPRQLRMKSLVLQGLVLDMKALSELADGDFAEALNPLV